ncbi:hypothetical protein ADUPG1_002329, partial [Aduncisulcus paluster]
MLLHECVVCEEAVRCDRTCFCTNVSCVRRLFTIRRDDRVLATNRECSAGTRRDGIFPRKIASDNRDIV